MNNIFVIKYGQQHGPFTEDEVQMKLATGEFSANDLGWYNGLPDWQPLSKILTPAQSQPPYPAPQPAIQSSGLATISFIFAMVGVLFWMIMIGVFNTTHQFRRIDHDLVGIMVILIFLFTSLNIVGLVFGIIGTVRQISNKWAAIVGLAVNGVCMFILFFLMTTARW